MKIIRDGQYLLLHLPEPLAQFRCVRAGPTPFVRLLDYLRKESGLPDLQFADTAIGPQDYADLRGEVARWVSHRKRLGYTVRDTGTFCLSFEGITAPRVNRKLRHLDALVVLPAKVLQ